MDGSLYAESSVTSQKRKKIPQIPRANGHPPLTSLSWGQSTGNSRAQPSRPLQEEETSEESDVEEEDSDGSLYAPGNRKENSEELEGEREESDGSLSAWGHVESSATSENNDRYQNLKASSCRPLILCSWGTSAGSARAGPSRPPTKPEEPAELKLKPTFSVMLSTNLGETHIVGPWRSFEKARDARMNSWSMLIYFESDVSNQVLAFIHHWLEHKLATTPQGMVWTILINIR